MILSKVILKCGWCSAGCQLKKSGANKKVENVVSFILSMSVVAQIGHGTFGWHNICLLYTFILPPENLLHYFLTLIYFSNKVWINFWIIHFIYSGMKFSSVLSSVSTKVNVYIDYGTRFLLHWKLNKNRSHHAWLGKMCCYCKCARSLLFLINESSFLASLHKI